MGYHPAGYAKGITNSKTVAEEGEYALDARQNNPSLPDTLAYEIKRIEAEFAEKLSSALEWKLIVKTDYLQANVVKEIAIPSTANEVWFLLGQDNLRQIYGGVSAVIPKNENDQNIIFFPEVYGGYGQLLIKKVFIQYAGNVLSLRYGELVATDKHISARVYYR